jgi:hypothetical protein
VKGGLAVHLKASMLSALIVALVGCGGPEPTEEPSEPREAPPRETVFDPLTSTIGRAQGVQQTVDEQAAEQRRRIEDAER